jgi:hypothetical protein
MVMNLLNILIMQAQSYLPLDPSPENITEVEALLNRALAREWCGDPDAALPKELRVTLPHRVTIPLLEANKAQSEWERR